MFATRLLFQNEVGLLSRQVLKVNAGGRVFETFAGTLLKYPRSLFAQKIERALAPPAEGAGDLAAVGPSNEVFFDTDPKVFESVMSFLRTGRITLPTDNERLRNELVHFLESEELFEHAFPRAVASGSSADDIVSGGNGEAGESTTIVQLPDVCVVQLCDHMQHDQGVKRHAVTISYGADGFQLRGLAKRIRKDLNTQLASTYWQVYQTNERAAFFVTTKVANGTADLMTTSISQQVITHTESMGYSLTSSYVTLSPDVVHTNVRMLVHNFIFRRVRMPTPEASDALIALQNSSADETTGNEVDDVVDPALQVHPNFEPPAVGPQKSMWDNTPPVVPAGQRLKNIWK
ncbi:potassium voltage-gated channel protein, putative [Bodo saltans]|uniref:Potassium voltage-gated channel protein, putative n=1 Tax=Bodo saltans TaxID=75058 RepID=A0A0S4JGQ4_BODSA|nr:potassium voltage-gated channel protein, putative [Bodo saltans]|eukprot:CUG89492.1 potassium voltage-gated channel protein, putative [Bodo saltans]